MSALLQARVEAMRYEANRIVSVELVAANDKEQLPAAEAGAHIDLHLPNGVVRSYSLCDLATGGGLYRIGVAHDRNSRGGSKYVHESLRVGSVIPISSPRNNFRLSSGEHHSVLVAGGIGVTPIMAMVKQLASAGRPFSLLCCARTQSDVPFVRELTALAGPCVEWHLDEAAGGPPDLVRYLSQQSADTHFYCCGPSPMLDAFVAACASHAYPNVHIERFSAELSAADAGEKGFDIELARSARTVHVQPGQSILAVLRDAGVQVEYGCEQGVCGACESKVLSGDVIHRDSVLSEVERGTNATMMICVSGCRSQRLVLDL